LYPGPVETPWEESIARLCAGRMEPDWPPGAKAGYHPFTSWSLLGEIIRRIDGRNCADYVRQEICLPLGMHNTWLALSSDQYAQYGPRMGQLMNTAHQHVVPSELDTPEKAAHPRPASSIRGPIRELGFFYEMLLGGGVRRDAAGEPISPRLLQAATVAEITRRQRAGMVDQTFKTQIDWGLGLLINSATTVTSSSTTVAPGGSPGLEGSSNPKEPQGAIIEHPYGFGPYAGRDAFGHGGSQSSIGMADPQHGLVVAAHFNGCPGEPAHDRRNNAFFRALYEDLGLAG
ncbi:MAG: serine hydrolase domain-containing protein, partial [Phycisphaerae bacterium]